MFSFIKFQVSGWRVSKQKDKKGRCQSAFIQETSWANTRWRDFKINFEFFGFDPKVTLYSFELHTEKKKKVHKETKCLRKYRSISSRVMCVN